MTSFPFPAEVIRGSIAAEAARQVLVHRLLGALHLPPAPSEWRRPPGFRTRRAFVRADFPLLVAAAISRRTYPRRM